MGIFGRKNEEDYDEEDGFREEEELKDRKLTRKFKDLKPENKKKRKEPPKPWGRRERITLLIIILMTVLISGILTLTSESKRFLNLPKLNFSFPKINFGSLNFFKEETITIKKSGN
ncbi:MAG: hypothetical protein UT58_C0012G0011 [Microgenomates group bacterium GW2011_GWC1_39_7b]|uniref:Uncharacterized protein n=3 Tax=Candidatus Woeseibacteriota TaxID=1752722 RepID=A0A0G0X6F7_9BACT|nr:MAG: hypothetical protein UT17_C0001G0049 [Candidatus Woesebacteria bacterium GW2011_GWB1_39_10]KKR26456.1 MAG: hypothetical protein UT58_C0012G0011 [Microgenomates group bacterium GW2011_GWC1_39_7b]KKR73977.1 MAG: hypothetical protein UU16_C0008G0007 [Candidatus Woesebacteria bacterium GW2011_GWA2_40_7]KKR92235.1 MAG: hypothetical protein UU42_C0002G0049 [Candidatus Woesebacteria bacterium GW2011_GWA1_41_13b]